MFSQAIGNIRAEATADRILRRGGHGTNFAFLSKPFSLSTLARKEKGRCGVAVAFSKTENKRSSVGPDRRLDFRFVNVEVRVHVLHVVVFFEGFYESHHLRCLRARQLDVILRHHADLR